MRCEDLDLTSRWKKECTAQNHSLNPYPIPNEGKIEKSTKRNAKQKKNKKEKQAAEGKFKSKLNGIHGKCTGIWYSTSKMYFWREEGDVIGKWAAMKNPFESWGKRCWRIVWAIGIWRSHDGKFNEQMQIAITFSNYKIRRSLLSGTYYFDSYQKRYVQASPLVQEMFLKNERIQNAGFHAQSICDDEHAPTLHVQKVTPENKKSVPQGLKIQLPYTHIRQISAVNLKEKGIIWQGSFIWGNFSIYPFPSW